jgi:hypothetical protein
MTRLTFFILMPSLERHAPMILFAQEEKNELYVSPHVRLCGFSGMAHIETKSLAEKYAEAIAPIFQKRYGNGTTLEVVSLQSGIDKKTTLRIAKDTEIIKKRLATNNFASNKAP